MIPVPAPPVWRAASSRGACFAALWAVLLPSGAQGDLALGLFTVGTATWTSLRLLPPSSGHLRLARLLLLAPYYLRESVRAGVDVALRAFSPRVRVQPGYVHYPADLPPGLARNTFTSITSLLPGTVPCDEENGRVVYHALDTGQPVLEQLTAEEHRLSAALRPGSSHG
jgi:multicomponent Na+:H+ antiporter subunit E